MATKYASNSSTLLAALNSASAGDKIVLAAGNYGNVTLTNHDFSGTVTLAGARKASFTGLTLRNVENLTLDGLALDYVPGKSPSDKPFTVDGSRNVAIRNADFDGHLSGGYGEGIGLRVMRSSQITVENSTFDKFVRGAGFQEVTGLTVRGNDMRLMSEDAMSFAQVIQARIENNHLHDMQTPPARLHKDLIQFWSTNTTKPSSDVVIRGNVLESDEPGVHGIFMGNEIGRTNKSFKYQNIVIENNKITSGHVLGLAVEHANKVTIRGNDVRIHPDLPKTSINTPVIDVTPDSTGVIISGNTAHRLPDETGAGWSVSGNKLVSAPGTPGKAPGPVTVDPGSSGGVSGGGSKAPADDDGTTFRFTGSQSKGKTDKVSGFDFADGDRLILQDYAPGTLKGLGADSNPLAVNKVGTYAVLDSRADLSELDAASPAVKLSGSGGTLVLSITQGGGRHDIHLSGVAATGSSGSSGTGSKAPAAGADGTDFRFTGSMAKAGKNAAPGGFDFADGDRLILQDFAAGVLKGWGADSNPLAVNKAGTYAVLDSLADVYEIAGASGGVNALARGDTLVLDLDPRAGGEIHLAGLGHEFLAL